MFVGRVQSIHFQNLCSRIPQYLIPKSPGTLGTLRWGVGAEGGRMGVGRGWEGLWRRGMVGGGEGGVEGGGGIGEGQGEGGVGWDGAGWGWEGWGGMGL
jgi:hypothetical protein